jgi:hypothetical protein
VAGGAGAPILFTLTIYNDEYDIQTTASTQGFDPESRTNVVIPATTNPDLIERTTAFRFD